jgi:predicted AlkP superfamily pyrophosphatase or phosphodiesterase
MIAQSDNIVPERMLLAAHPLVDDIDEAYKQLLEQRQQRIEQQQAFMSDYGQPPENEEEDGADE